MWTNVNILSSSPPLLPTFAQPSEERSEDMMINTKRVLLSAGILLLSLQMCMWYTRFCYPYIGIHFPLYSRLVLTVISPHLPPEIALNDLFFFLYPR